MSLIHDILALRRGPRDPQPDPGFARQKNRTVLKAALEGLTTPFKNYVNYAAFPDRIPQTAENEPHDKVLRRAVHYTNAQLGIQGLVRGDFDKEMNDRLARNAIYALCEKGVMDYFGTAEWEIVNEKGDQQTRAMKALRRPNPHQTLPMVLKETVRDTTRYDAGVMVNSLTADGYLGELRSFHGPDFWIEVDRDWTGLDGIGSQYYGPWSHGMVKRYWQHSRPGIYIPFEPKEICYMMLYPKTDSMYGTDFLSRVRWPLEYLIDSTKSAGMTFANGLAPGAIWKHPDYTSIEELAERELDIELNHLGSENFGGILHLIGNESIESFTPTLHDLEWIEGQKFFTDIVLAMFGFSSSEFFQGDMNRATAYIGRNITKSRMLYPLQIHFQNMLTAKVLPLMEGWEDDWEFKFCDTVDLDDELKRAQINQTRASTASSYAMLGLSIESALELAEVDDDLRTAVQEDLDALKNQEGTWTDGLPTELPPDQAEQYYGDAGGEDYEGTAVDGDDAENQEDEEDVQKADRVYLNQGEEPPKGIQVKVGPRGGRYYTSETGRQEAPAPTKGEDPARNPDLADDHFMVRRDGVTWRTSRTGLAAYDEELQAGAYRYTPRLTWMDAEAFLDYQVKQFGLRTHVKDGLTPRERFDRLVDDEKVQAIREAVQSGRTLPAFFLEFDPEGNLVDEQEGRHRILALIDMGVKHVPVWLFRQKATPGHKTPGDPPLPVEGEEEIAGEDPDVQKARVYLHPGEKPPAGVRVQRGPRGGQYYEARAIGAGQQSLPAGSSKPLTPPERPWEKEMPDPIPWKDGGREEFIRALEGGKIDGLEAFAEYEGMALGPGLKASLIPGGRPIQIDPENVLGRVKGGRLRIMPWYAYKEWARNEYNYRPLPPISREVDRVITQRGSLDWNPDHEVGTVFTRDGEEVYRKRGDKHSISFTKEELIHFEGNVFTHTHPSGGPFSEADLEFASHVELTEIRAAGDRWEFILQPPEDTGRFTEKLFASKIRPALASTNKELYDLFWGKINNNEISVDEAGSQHQHLLWERVAKATGIRYTRRPRDAEEGERS
ncbi:MAG: hypothetical protein WC277_02080 [Bacilli bacterium]